jgi:ribosomal protein L24
MKLKPNKKFQIPFKRWQIVRGDRVMVRSGGDKGKIGTVIRVFRKSNMVVVKGVNVRRTKESINHM